MQMTTPTLRTLIAGTAALLLSGCVETGEVRVEALASDAIEVPPEVLRNSGSRFRAFADGTPTVLYLHFDGITITKSAYKSDAASNTSFIGGGTVPAFVGDAATREKIISLVKQLYAAYNIQVVTTRPSSGDYDMAVIGGRPGNLGLSYPSGVTGVAPMDCSDKMPRDIAFVFSDSIKSLVYPADYAKRVAETTAHESAHTYGLPHSNDGCDLMSYSGCSQLKTFLNKSMQMQSDSYGQCGLTSMNSHQLLLQTVGPAGTTAPPPTEPPPPAADTQPPAVAITAPASGATVATTTTVKATISDDRGVVKAELALDGKVVSTRTAAPFEFPVSLTAGQRTLVVNGYDAAGNKGSAAVTVTVDSQTTPDPAPAPPGQTGPELTDPPPSDTVPPPQPGAFGTECTGPSDCESGLCAEDSGGKYCTEGCDPTGTSCPGGASCLPADGVDTHVCSAPVNSVAASPEGTLLVGSCSFAAGPAGLGSSWPILLALALFLCRRRR